MKLTGKAPKPNELRSRSVAIDGTLTATQMREVVFSDNSEAREWFARIFPGQLRATIKALTRAFNAYQDLSGAIAMEMRPATVMLFVHAAVNSVVSSVQLFVSGYPIPAGHLMRQYAECIAMAMLCADKTLDVFARYDADKRRFPVHKALEIVTREKVAKSLVRTLGLQREGYRQFVEVMRFYDNLSHASAVSLGYTLMFTKGGGLVIGSQVDPTKRTQYKSELLRYQKAADTISTLVAVLHPVLDKKPQ